MTFSSIRLGAAWLLAGLGFGFAARAAESQVVAVWSGVPAGSENQSTEEKLRIHDNGERVVSNVHRPTFSVHLPDAARATGAAVLVLPGGGHRELWMDHEGYSVATWLAERGVAAFVLKYRLARQEGSTYTVQEHALADAQRALRLIRHRATEWRIDPARVGVMGFSAGGELAALTALRYDEGKPDTADPVARESSRPAFQALIYPGGSRGMMPTKESPPVFLLCGENDRPDISMGLPQLYARFREAGVSAELHVLAGVGHGFGVRERNTGAVGGWPERFHEWLDGRGMLAAKKTK